MDIQHLKHGEINFIKWDSTIKNSRNTLIYALSWFLDIVSPNWEALIVGDYEIIMPLTIKRKWGMRYVFKPFFAQFYGIFSKKELNAEVIQEFIDKASTKVHYLDIWLNPGNPLNRRLFSEERRTQEILLIDDYEKIKKCYSRSNKNNLKKAGKEGLEIRKEPNGEIEINLLRGMYSRKNVEGYREEDFLNLGKIYDHSVKSKEIKTDFYTLYKDKKPCAAAFILEWNKRAIIYHAANEIGRKLRAMFVLVDEYIKDHAGQDLVFDFAGSNIHGVAEWNEGFGAKSLNYHAVHINKLPIPLRWLKR